MKKRSTTYALKPIEREIFERSRSDPSVFTGFYFFGKNTGTYALPNADDSRVDKLYRVLNIMWKRKDKPQTFSYTHDPVKVPDLIIPTYPCDVTVNYGFGSHDPKFLIHHGFTFQPFQTEWVLAKQEMRVVIGAFGSSKTITSITEMLWYAATIPGFRGFVIAPYSRQSTEVFTKAMDAIRGTRYEERFLLRAMANKPETLMIGNDYVGQSQIDFISILDDPTKILNLEGDMAMVDQTERLPDIPEVRRALSTRLRGNYQGRERMGIINWLANPYDNPGLWDLFDSAEEDPENIYARQISTYDNLAITQKQLRRYQRDVGTDQQSQDVFLFGRRPVGDGKQFPGESVNLCRASWLDERMAKGLAEKTPGYLKEESRIGVFRWETPYEEGHTYLEVADPGWGNPPTRNAAAIGVWDITNFPDSPAFMVAFSWEYGNGSPLPWMQRFADYANRYRCKGRCCYDSTGLQSGYDKLVELFNELMSEGLNLSGNKKYEYLNFMKTMMSKGLIQFPTISGIISQLMKYDLPDTNIPQDIVSMIAMSCGKLEEYFYLSGREEFRDVALVRTIESRAVWRDGRFATRRR